jgi:glycosyltransferase involved in cell wall biosynthesis
LKVVFVAGRDPRDEVSGGHSAYVRSYGRAARRAGYEPHLFCAARDSRVDEAPFGVVHRVASPVRPFRQLAAGAHAAWLAPAIVRFVRDEVLEAGEVGVAGRGRFPRGRALIHGFGVWGYAGQRAAVELRQQGCDAVTLLGSYTSYEEEARAGVEAAEAGEVGSGRRFASRLHHAWTRLAVETWERQAYLGARFVLLNYDVVRRVIEAKYPTARCLKIPYTCEAAFERLPGSGKDGHGDIALPPEIAALDEPQAPLIVAVSRHEPRKGVDVLLHALAALRQSGVALRACLVGGGILLAEHRALAAKLGLAGVVAVTGPVPHIWPYLAPADLFVLPSRTEQSGSLAVIEALLSGKAVVASGVDGLLEDLTDDGDALLVPPGDGVALAQALRGCLLDEPLRRRLAERGRETFAASFSPAAVAARLGDLYAGLGFGL